jgi:hypothetical protein
MRACEQCGLSIGDSATFCMVCGARVDPSATAVVATDTVAAPEPTLAPDGVEVAAEQPVAEQPVIGQPAVQDVPAEDTPQDAMSRRVRDAALPMREAGDIEKSDPERAVALYRESILSFLEAAADPLDQETVRHDLLVIFDRLSLVLKREGQPEEALEEIDSAASLGLLDCRDRGVKGHREALTKRRESLRHAVDGGPRSPV